MITEIYYYIKSTQLQRNIQHFLNKNGLNSNQSKLFLYVYSEKIHAK